MPVLRIAGLVLLVVLCVLLGLIVLLHLLLIPRTGIRLCADSVQGVRLWVRYGPKTFLILPRPKKKKKKPVEKPQEAPPEPGEPEEKKKLAWKNLDLGDTICYALDLLRQLKNTLRIDLLQVHVILATGDAGKTGQLLGQLSAIVSTVYAFLMNTFSIKDCQIAVDGDFEGKKTTYDAAFSLSLRPIILEWVMLRNARRLYRLYRLLTKTEAETK